MELRLGSTGAGVYVGCGAGVGLITPINLHAVPVLGQLLASLSSSLGGLNHATGGLATAARSRVRGLGVRNLDLGFGCGVMAGYGYGAGLFVTPTALQHLSASLHAVGQRVTARLPAPLQSALQQHQQQLGPSQLHQQGLAAGLAGNASGAGSAAQGPLLLPPQHPQQSQGDCLAHVLISECTARLRSQISSQADTMLTLYGPHAEASTSGRPTTQQQQALQQEQQEVVQLTKLVLKQQNQLVDLEQQVRTLQDAVCKLDASAPGCKARP